MQIIVKTTGELVLSGASLLRTYSLKLRHISAYLIELMAINGFK